jgi:hypothetical protein
MTTTPKSDWVPAADEIARVFKPGDRVRKRATETDGVLIERESAFLGRDGWAVQVDDLRCFWLLENIEPIAAVPARDECAGCGKPFPAQGPWDSYFASEPDGPFLVCDDCVHSDATFDTWKPKMLERIRARRATPVTNRAEALARAQEDERVAKIAKTLALAPTAAEAPDPYEQHRAALARHGITETNVAAKNDTRVSQQQASARLIAALAAEQRAREPKSVLVGMPHPGRNFALKNYR